jgi:hypothetical protein
LLALLSDLVLNLLLSLSHSLLSLLKRTALQQPTQ